MKSSYAGLCLNPGWLRILGWFILRLCPIILEFRMTRVQRRRLFLLFWDNFLVYHPTNHPTNHPGVILAYGLVAAIWTRFTLDLHKNTAKFQVIAVILPWDHPGIILGSSWWHPGIILPWPRRVLAKRLVKAIILVSSCPGSWLVPSSWHHPGNLK